MADVAVGYLDEGREPVVVDFGAECLDALFVEFETPDFAVLLLTAICFCGFVTRGIAVEDCSSCGVRE